MSTLRLQQALESIQPGEKRLLEKTAEPSVEQNRWYEFATRGEINSSLFLWDNRPDLVERPRAATFFEPGKPVTSIPAPKVRFVGTPSQLSDLYYAGDEFFVSQRVFDVIMTLDPTSVEWVQIDVENTPAPYSYCLCTRVLDVLDEERTNIEVLYERLTPLSTKFIKMVRIKGGLCAIDQSVADSFHCIKPLFANRPLWSRELVDAVIASGATGLYFRPPFSTLFEHRIYI